MDIHHYQKNAHYINIPYGQGYYFPEQGASQNALMAIDSATQVLKKKNASSAEKILALRVLFHVIADIHQPMHTINFYSKRFPDGDRGGNLYTLPYHSSYHNLHHLWDMAGGQKWNAQSVSRHSCQGTLNAPWMWVQDSFLLAAREAYFPPRSRKKWKNYQIKVQKISQHQIEKAACHLAAYLDEIYNG